MMESTTGTGTVRKRRRRRRRLRCTADKVNSASWQLLERGRWGAARARGAGRGRRARVSDLSAAELSGRVARAAAFPNAARTVFEFGIVCVLQLGYSDFSVTAVNARGRG
ncbi:unnamed protein product [Plutella xylostella]|uniref:(diamondback moth) hypothetical protein n=1 Tax=Plutella xylostella TaxID=51655 RepID=A0A8S4FXY5_PLUXY|nr:unnamed protein product [Plutella xylostella]